MPWWGWLIVDLTALVVGTEVTFRIWVFTRAVKLQKKALEAVLEARDRKAARNLRSGIDPLDRP